MVGAHFMKFCGKWDMQRIAPKCYTICPITTEELSGEKDAVCG